MFLVSAAADDHESRVLTQLLAEDPASVDGLDSRVDIVGDRWLRLPEAVAQLRESVARSGRMPALHTVRTSFTRHGRPVRLAVEIVAGRIVAVERITWHALLDAPPPATITLVSADPASGPITFVCAEQPALALQLNRRDQPRLQKVRVALGSLLRAGYRLGGETIRVTPSFVLRRRSDGAGELEVETTLQSGKLGARAFAEICRLLPPLVALPVATAQSGEFPAAAQP